MQKHASRLSWTLFLICCSIPPLLSSAQSVANKQKIIGQARGAYYNLRSEGLAEFQCSVTPDWRALLADLGKSDPAAADGAVKTLNELHFRAKLGLDGKVQITHNEPQAQNQQMADAFRQIYGGMEQMANGFFDTWSLFMLNPPFPDVTSEYRLEALGPQYLLTYREDATTDVSTTMDQAFVINSLRVTTTKFDSAIQPRFTKTPKGLLFSAYDASYQSSSPGETTQLKVTIGYQEVDGLQLIQKLDLSGAYGGSPFAVQLTFSDCKVTKK